MSAAAVTPHAAAAARSAEAHLAKGEHPAAEAVLKDAVAAHPGDPTVASVAGRLLMWRLQNHQLAFPLIERALAAFPDDPDLLWAHSYAAWIVDQRKPEAARALHSILRVADFRPEDGNVYRLMGMIALSRQNYALARLALAKAMTLNVNCRSYLTLTEALIAGRQETSVTLDGETYRFGLTTQTTQTIEAGAYHCAGALTEIQELRFLKDKIAPGGVLVEVGVLVGNHSAYFLRNFRPRKLIMFDADPELVPVIRANAERNNNGSEIVVHNAFVAARSGESIEFADRMVPVRALSEAVTDKVDFIKIDVDGAENDTLAGAATLIEQHRPQVMIEVTPVTIGPVKTWFGTRGYGLIGEIGHTGYVNLFWRHGAA